MACVLVGLSGIMLVLCTLDTKLQLSGTRPFSSFVFSGFAGKRVEKQKFSSLPLLNKEWSVHVQKLSGGTYLYTDTYNRSGGW
jgi:hypothetical protein